MAGLPLTVVQQHALLAQAQLARPAVATAATAAQQQMRVSDANAARKLANKKRKTQEKPVSEKPVHLVPESALFNSLVMQERELDYQIKRRRLEIQAAALPYDHPLLKRLRLYIYSTHSHQPGQQGSQQQNSSQQQPPQEQQQQQEQSSQEPPQWTLCLWGRLVEMTDPPPAPGSDAAAMLAAAQATLPSLPAPPNHPQQQQGKHHPFTSFFKRIEVQLDSEQYPDDQGMFLWEKIHHRGPHKDRIEIKRTGTSNVKATITLEQEFMPPAFKLSQGLAELLGVTIGRQNSVLARVWTYMQKQKQHSETSQVLQLDEKLSAALGCSQQIPRDGLPALVGKQLSPIGPIKLDYTMDLSGVSLSNIMCVDIDVLLPTKVLEKVVPTLDALLEGDKQVETLEQRLSTNLNKLYEARRRRAMYLGFAEAPVSFINAAIASQARELRITRTGPGAGRDAELERRTDVFNEKWVEEAAAKYLAKRNNFTIM